MPRIPRQQLRPTRDRGRPTGATVTRAQRDAAVKMDMPLEVWRDELRTFRESPQRRGRGSGNIIYPELAYERRLAPSVIGGNYIMDNQVAPL